MSKILDKATAFAKGKKVKCTITVLDAKNQSVENYKKRLDKFEGKWGGLIKWAEQKYGKPEDSVQPTQEENKQDQPATHNQPPTTHSQRPTTNNQQPTTSNQQPTTAFTIRSTPENSIIGPDLLFAASCT